MRQIMCPNATQAEGREDSWSLGFFSQISGPFGWIFRAKPRGVNLPLRCTALQWERLRLLRKCSRNVILGKGVCVSSARQTLEKTAKCFDSIKPNWEKCSRDQMRSYRWRKLYKAERPSPWQPVLCLMCDTGLNCGTGYKVPLAQQLQGTSRARFFALHHCAVNAQGFSCPLSFTRCLLEGVTSIG